MPKKVLVVDDEPQIVLLVSGRLKANGFEVIEASNGEEGLRKAKSERPDLILLDIMMPGMDGYEVCAALKSDQRYKDIPIILFTAKAGEEAQRVGLEDCGANGYVTKPFEPSALLSKISEFLN